MFIEYCSSDAWLGDSGPSAATFEYSFRGSRIFSATLAALVNEVPAPSRHLSAVARDRAPMLAMQEVCCSLAEPALSWRPRETRGVTCENILSPRSTAWGRTGLL